MYSDFNKWIEFLTNNDDPLYYENLLNFSHDIVTMLNNPSLTKQGIAKQLHMSAPKLSTLAPIFKVIADAQD